MTTTLSLVPIQALSTTSSNGLQMSGPYILVRATTVAQQVQANRKLGKKPVPPSPKEPEALRCKRRTDSNALHNILPRPQPAAVARRNERERNRVKMVNNGFDTLREHVPFGKKNKKMSKVDTLKAAADYIKYLQEILSSDTSSLPSPVKTNLAESTETSSDSQVTEDPALEKINSCTENITNGDEIQQRLGDSQYIDISNSSGQKDCENNNIACYENNNNLSSINNNNNNNNNNQIGSNAENSCFTFINHSQNGQVDNNDFFASLQDNTNFSFCAALRDPEGFGFVRSPTVSNASSMHSPSPSLCSDAISDNLSSEEDELPDIGSWFS